GGADVPVETPLAAPPARRAQCSRPGTLYLPSSHLLEKSRVPAGLGPRPFVTLKTISERFEKSKNIRGGFIYGGSRSEWHRVQEAITRGHSKDGTVPQRAQPDCCRTTCAQRLRLAACRYPARSHELREALRHAKRHRERRRKIAGTRWRIRRSPRHPASSRSRRRRCARALHQYRRRGSSGDQLHQVPYRRYALRLLSAAQHEQGWT